MAFAINALGSRFRSLGTVFLQVGCSTFYSSWCELAVDAGMTEALALKALGRDSSFVDFNLD